VGIGTRTPVSRLHVYGDIRTTGGAFIAQHERIAELEKRQP
jgi:hypothetical protein